MPYIYDVRVIEEKGDEKYYHNVGVAFDCKDGSVNVKIYTQPGVVFNIKERKAKEKQNG